MPRRSKREKPRANPDPRRIARVQDFYLLDTIQRRLKRQHTSPLIGDEKLADFLIARSSPFDIDQDDPVDVEPRYFLPGPVEAMELALMKSPLDWPDFIRGFHPIENHLGQGTDSWDVRWHARGAAADASSIGRQFNATAAETTGWHHDWHFPCAYKPHGDSQGELPDGRAFCHLFESGWFWKRMVVDEEGLRRPHPDLPHSLAAVYDGARPKGGSLLRSELLMAIAQIKTQVRQLDGYLDHHVFPALVLSFHGRFSARILQAHLYNGQLIVRTSRLINLHTHVMTPDMQLLLRWHNSRPVGETRRLRPEAQGTRDEGAVEISHFNQPEVISRPTGSRAA